jgi:hypothetical protein
MALAPSPKLEACLEVLYRASVEARLLGYEGHGSGLPPENCDRLAALMDAVHNIPHLILQWERCDEALLRGMLRDYDARWGAGLLDTYERRIDQA